MDTMHGVLQMKTCTKCGETKPATLEFFSSHRTQSSGLRPDCKDCSRAYHRALYAKDREARKEKVRAYHHANRETLIPKMRERHQRRVQKDPDGYRQKRRTYYILGGGREKWKAYVKARRASDPKYRLRQNLGVYFWRLLKRKPMGGFQAYMGYTAAELHRHLERQFEPPMTWENYGTVWEVDHIVPVASFNLPDEARACWALSNLRPLLKGPNRQKGASRVYLL